MDKKPPKAPGRKPQETTVPIPIKEIFFVFILVFLFMVFMVSTDSNKKSELAEKNKSLIEENTILKNEVFGLRNDFTALQERHFFLQKENNTLQNKPPEVKEKIIVKKVPCKSSGGWQHIPERRGNYVR